MQHLEAEFRGEQGLRIWFQVWRPDRPKAVLVVAHGLGEHSGRYAGLAGYLAPRGIAVYALDHRGHGRSGGRRGHVGRFSDYTADLGRFIDHVRAAQPDPPVFLLGHSLGGVIVLGYALVRAGGLRGVVASAPGLRRRFEVPGYKLLLGRVLSDIWPTFTQCTGLPVDRLSHDPQVALEYAADRLVHGQASARLFTELTQAGEDLLAGAPDLGLPCLLLQGCDDHLIDVQATVEFYEKAGSTDKTLYLYEGYYHECLNEVGRERVLADVAAWLEARLLGVWYGPEL